MQVLGLKIELDVDSLLFVWSGLKLRWWFDFGCWDDLSLGCHASFLQIDQQTLTPSKQWPIVGHQVVGQTFTTLSLCLSIWAQFFFFTFSIFSLYNSVLHWLALYSTLQNDKKDNINQEGANLLWISVFAALCCSSMLYALSSFWAQFFYILNIFPL